MADAVRQRGPHAGSIVGVLTSRLGRRFVMLFAGCAMLPLVCFAWLSASRVHMQVRQNLRDDLHAAAKGAGMALTARLSQVRGDLALIADMVQTWRADGLWSDGVRLERQLRGRSVAAWLIDGNGVQPLIGDPVPVVPAPDADGMQHLRSGGGLLTRLIGDRLLMRVLLDAEDTENETQVLVEINGDWLFDAGVLRGPGCEVGVYDMRGSPLFHSWELVDDPFGVGVAMAGDPSSGSFEWTVDGEAHTARYWRAFLRPQYGIDLVVVQSKLREEAFAMEASFTRWFWLTALGTLSVVLLASLIQIRRTLDPVLSLREATEQLGRGDLDVRVSIASDDELGDLGVAFNAMARGLQENIAERERSERELIVSRDAALAAVRAKAEFVTNVSHEFRTPMAEILGATEILASLGSDDEETRDEFERIALHGAQRLSRLLDDVLELGQGPPAEMQSVDVGDSIQDAIDAMPRRQRGRVECAIAESLPRVRGDRQRLTDVWRRLLDNALKFSPIERKVQVRVVSRGENVVVEVVDRGVGIAYEDLGRVFEPFLQVGRDQLIDKAIGTGLGLTLARSAVQMHGGKLTVSSRQGVGSTFRVVLPAEQPAVESVESAGARQRRAGGDDEPVGLIPPY